MLKHFKALPWSAYGLPASFLAVFFVAHNAYAQTNTPSLLESVVVTGTRTAERIDETLAHTTVINQQQIQAATGTSLAELLAQQAGITHSSNGGLGKSSSIFVRGLEARHTLLLIDGIRYGSATLGTPVWENIALEAIERIEIVRGPLSGLYGSDAVAGVIQIFTKRGTQGRQVQGSAAVGTDAYRRASAGLSFGQNGLEAALQAQHVRTEGFSATNAQVPFGSFNPDNDGFKQSSGQLHLGWKLTTDWHLDARLLHSKGISQIDDGPGADARVELVTKVYSLQAAGKLLPLWRTSMVVGRSVDEYNTLATASSFTDLGVIATQQTQINWENTLTTALGTALLLAERLQQDVTRPQEPFAVSERTIDAYAAGINGSAGLHTWQANVRHDRNSQFRNQTTGTLAYGVDIAAQWRAALSYGTSFVAPSFNQLYFPNFGNPNLQPEEGKHREFSLRWTNAAQQVRLTYFDNRIRGFISSGPQPTNVPYTRIDGWSLSYEGRIRNVSLTAGVDVQDPRNATQGSANIGKQLPRRAKNTMHAGLRATLSDAWNIGAHFNAVGKRFDDSANLIPLPGYATLNMHADWRLAANWSVGVKLNNVTDKQYQTAQGYNQAGREGFVTLQYRN
jgi:vitamin B12 transporter